MSYNKVDQTTGALQQLAGSQINSIYADAPLGAILSYGGDTAPTGWLLCDGSAVSRTTYAQLFEVIGTKYGPGDGSTTFNLPDGVSGAELYPVGDAGSGISGSVYIIKAVHTQLPVDFQSALDEKQDIVDDALETTSKEIVGAINELNGNKLLDITSQCSVTTGSVYLQVLVSPKSRTTRIELAGSKDPGFGNGEIVIIIPAEYFPTNLGANYLLGACGNCRLTGGTYGGVIAVATSSTHSIAINYSVNDTALNVGFSVVLTY